MQGRGISQRNFWSELLGALWFGDWVRRCLRHRAIALSSVSGSTRFVSRCLIGLKTTIGESRLSATTSKRKPCCSPTVDLGRLKFK